MPYGMKPGTSKAKKSPAKRMPYKSGSKKKKMPARSKPMKKGYK